MYISDNPIESKKDDILGRENFSEKLAQSLINSKNGEMCFTLFQ